MTANAAIHVDGDYRVPFAYAQSHRLAALSELLPAAETGMVDALTSNNEGGD